MCIIFSLLHIGLILSYVMHLKSFSYKHFFKLRNNDLGIFFKKRI